MRLLVDDIARRARPAARRPAAPVARARPCERDWRPWRRSPRPMDARSSTAPIRTIAWAVPASRRQVGHDMLAQQMAEAGKAIGGALDGAGKFEHGERGRDSRLPAEHQRRDRALLRPPHARRRSGARRRRAHPRNRRDVPRAPRRGGKPGGCGLCCRHRDGAELATAPATAARRARRRQRSDEGGLFELVHRLLGAIDSSPITAAGVESGDFARAPRARCDRPSARSARPAGELFGVGRAAGAKRYEIARDRDGEIVRQTDLAQHGRKQRAVTRSRCRISSASIRSPTRRTDRPGAAPRGESRRPISENRSRPPPRASSSRSPKPMRSAAALRTAAAAAHCRRAREGRDDRRGDGGPIEHVTARSLATKPRKQLARLVPVDQEHQRRAEVARNRGAPPVLARIAASDEEKAFFLAKPAAHGARARSTPRRMFRTGR